MISCSLTLDEDIDSIYNLFLPEMDFTKTKRAEFTINKTASKLSILITAKDFTSLKAFMSSIFKIIGSHKKIQELQQ